MTFLQPDGAGTPTSLTAKIRTGETVLQTAQRNRIALDFSCTEGTCGSCRVQVVNAPDELEPAQEVELETKLERRFADHERLGCQMNACAGLIVKIP